MLINEARNLAAVKNRRSSCSSRSTNPAAELKRGIAYDVQNRSSFFNDLRPASN